MSSLKEVVTMYRKQGLSSDEILEQIIELSEMFRNFPVQLAETAAKSRPITDKEIKDLLRKVGVPCNINGYKYLPTAVRLYMENPNQKFRDEFYPQVAKLCGSTPEKVERSIRNAVTTAWQRCPEEIMQRLFPGISSPRRGPTEFIAALSRNLRRE